MPHFLHRTISGGGTPEGEREAARRRKDNKGTCAKCGAPIHRIGVSDSWAHLGTAAHDHPPERKP